MHSDSSKIWEDVALFACGLFLALVGLYTFVVAFAGCDVELSPKTSAEIQQQVIEAMPTLIPLDDLDCAQLDDPTKLAEVKDMATADDPRSRAAAAMLLAACPDLAAQLEDVLSALASDNDPLARAVAEKAQQHIHDALAK